MIRKPTIDDAQAICDLIKVWAKKNAMLERPLNFIYEDIRDFWIYTEEDKIIGCCALHIIGWQGLAEIRSLAVDAGSQKSGIGGKLVKQCIEEAEAVGVKTVFALTYVDSFFKRMGFKDIDKNELPHKVWSECINCPSFPNCDEKAVAYSVKK
jgi:amino-acid N-acetyltransferase